MNPGRRIRGASGRHGPVDGGSAASGDPEIKGSSIPAAAQGRRLGSTGFWRCVGTAAAAIASRRRLGPVTARSGGTSSQWSEAVDWIVERAATSTRARANSARSRQRPRQESQSCPEGVRWRSW